MDLVEWWIIVKCLGVDPQCLSVLWGYNKEKAVGEDEGLFISDIILPAQTRCWDNYLASQWY